MIADINSSPTTIGHEKKINLFMRVDEERIQKLLGVENGIEAMRKLREMKDCF
jgi:Hydroxyacylglutathione hydrolase C-terminus